MANAKSVQVKDTSSTRGLSPVSKPKNQVSRDKQRSSSLTKSPVLPQSQKKPATNRKNVTLNTKKVAPEEMRRGLVDKLILVARRETLPEGMWATFAERMATIKSVEPVTRKGDNYQKKFVLKCPSGTKVFFGFLPAKAGMHLVAKIMLNPSQMELEDVRLFYEVLRQVFLPDWKSVLRHFLVQRADQAYDYPVAIENLIVQAVGLSVEEKFFVHSDKNARIETWYCGSIESQERYIAYDQLSSDEYKIDHGEKPSRPSAVANAEVVIDRHKGQSPMTRFESRRVFKVPLTVQQVDQKAPPFGRFVIYEISEAKRANAPMHFAWYLDSVRLRGVDGARKYFYDHVPGKAGKAIVAELEQYLSDRIAPWWDKTKLDCSLRHGLQDTPVWNVLRRLYE